MKSIEQQIQDLYSKLPARLKNNFLVRAAMNSTEELGGPEAVLEQLKDIKKYSGKTTRTVKFPELTTGLMTPVKAGKKKASGRSQAKRKAR
jgi:hypothetical protein